ncbi:DUF6132 family protein [Sediminibacterium goheungense]|uniref:Uncharacterized protein n=1 Tax=Sediminibacterium goheungense TaxID=1086393 RepID=A0A4R6J1R8_9BACT|nr:DUF6132 family protein [Sediminibacterium goheungense]TDO29199.1 hypothetical protein BC659_1282 [Sediminibacterium goheungense]
MKKWFKNNSLLLVGAVAGALTGYLYWKFVGCSSGTCAITSKPLNSTLYFAVLGMLVCSLFKKSPKKESHVE